MKKIAILAAIALIPLTVYAYMADHSNSYDDYQAFCQQFQRRDGDHHANMIFHHREGHFGDYRHHHAYSHEQYHQELGNECPGEGKGCEWLEGHPREGSRHWYPNYRHIHG